jgi:hypothetical protein
VFQNLSNQNILMLPESHPGLNNHCIQTRQQIQQLRNNQNIPTSWLIHPDQNTPNSQKHRFRLWPQNNQITLKRHRYR